MNVRVYIAVALLLGLAGMILGIIGALIYLTPAAILWSGAIIAMAILEQKAP